MKQVDFHFEADHSEKNTVRIVLRSVPTLQAEQELASQLPEVIGKSKVIEVDLAELAFVTPGTLRVLKFVSDWAGKRKRSLKIIGSKEVVSELEKRAKQQGVRGLPLVGLEARSTWVQAKRMQGYLRFIEGANGHLLLWDDNPLDPVYVPMDKKALKERGIIHRGQPVELTFMARGVDTMMKVRPLLDSDRLHNETAYSRAELDLKPGEDT